MLRVIELFSGIGAQAEALKELGLDYEVVATSDIDKHANLGYEAIHGKVNNLGDITKIEHLPECDLLTYSYPCTSISLAGKREGMVEGSGTASSLLWEVGRLLADMNERKILPEVLLMENVDAVLNKVNKPEFDRWCNILSEMGYCNSYTIMNAKDYGTPQNRKRIFMVSTLTMGEFVFPDPCPDGRVLRDVLEQDVPESYFLSEKRLATFKRHKERNDAKGNGFGFKVHEITDENREREEGDCSASVTNSADRYCATWIGIPKTECQSESGIVISGKVEPDFNQSGKVYDTEGMSATIRTPSGGGLIPKIEVPPIENAGELNIPNWHNTARSVAGVNGISPTICTQANNNKTKVLIDPKDSNEIIKAGELDRKFVQERDVISADGISKTVTANHHSSLSAVKVDVSDCENKVIKAGELTDSEFAEARMVMSKHGISRTITAEHQGCNSPKVLLDDGEKKE